MTVLSEAAVRRHARQGWLHLPAFVERGRLERLRAAQDALFAAEAGAGPVPTIRHEAWRALPELRELVLDGRLASVARRLLGCSVLLFQDHLVTKAARSSDVLRPHQDYSYWPLDRPSGLTAWLALDDADAARGCLRYAPGSHRLGERRPADFMAGAPLPEAARRADLPPLEWDEGAAVAVPVTAGDLLVHDPLTWHASGPNATDRPRRAWSTTWVAAHVRWDPQHAPHPFDHALAPKPGQALDGDHFPAFA